MKRYYIIVLSAYDIKTNAKPYKNFVCYGTQEQAEKRANDELVLWKTFAMTDIKVKILRADKLTLIK